MPRVIEKRQIIDDEKDRHGSVKYLDDLAEETEARIYAGLSMTNPAHLLLRRKQEVIQLSQQRPGPPESGPQYLTTFEET